jgi:hypothetical protein
MVRPARPRLLVDWGAVGVRAQLLVALSREGRAAEEANFKTEYNISAD